MIISALNYSSIKIREREEAEKKKKALKQKQKEQQERAEQQASQARFTTPSRDMGVQAGMSSTSSGTSTEGFEESLG